MRKLLIIFILVISLFGISGAQNPYNIARSILPPVEPVIDALQEHQRSIEWNRLCNKYKAQREIRLSKEKDRYIQGNEWFEREVQRIQEERNNRLNSLKGDGE